VQVDPERLDVTIDGVLVESRPAERLPLAQRYFV
jgi:urease alpha subunit